jgi:DNA-binding XRE family transcriptional regulator
MPLDVSNILEVSPSSIPAGGGVVQTAFEASTLEGESRLRAEYRLDPGIPYRIVGPASLEEDVSSQPQDFNQDLTLEATGDTAGIQAVDIFALVREVNAPGAPVQSRGRVTINAERGASGLAARAAVAPSGAGALGDRLKAFRKERGLTQREVAERAGVGRSTITRIEGGADPSDATRERLEAFLRS